MASGVGFFADGYFATNYWDGEFWAVPGTIGGDFWNDSYWAGNYWNSSYWSESTLNPGEVQVGNAGQLYLSTFVVNVTEGNTILASTGTLSLNSFVAGVNAEGSAAATTGSLTLTGYATTIGAATGYIIGDIDLQIIPDSTITITISASPGTPSVPLQTYHPTTQTENGVSIGVGPPSNLGLSSFPVNSQNNVEVEPLPKALTLTPLPADKAGIGVIVEQQNRPSLTLTPKFSRVVATSVFRITQKNRPGLLLQGATHSTFGVKQPFIPPPTWPGDSSIINPNADAFPSNYEICDRTGFKLRRGQLRKEWTGVMVRPESWEQRQPQDFVRAVSDDLKGSQRPEQDDIFVYDKYAGGVTADDL